MQTDWRGAHKRRGHRRDRSIRRRARRGILKTPDPFPCPHSIAKNCSTSLRRPSRVPLTHDRFSEPPQPKRCSPNHKPTTKATFARDGRKHRFFEFVFPRLGGRFDGIRLNESGGTTNKELFPGSPLRITSEPTKLNGSFCRQPTCRRFPEREQARCLSPDGIVWLSLGPSSWD